jgi:hypothetical protein
MPKFFAVEDKHETINICTLITSLMLISAITTMCQNSQSWM